MNFEPQKFFIGLTDFFSVLLPGALVAWLVSEWHTTMPLVDKIASLQGPAGWAAFLFASYVFGNVVFLLGAMLDVPYAWLRDCTLERQIKNLAGPGKLYPAPLRGLARVMFPGERNIALERASELKRASLRGLKAEEAMNTYQWSKAWLRAESPASLAEVERFEAHSKFFRCLAIVLLLLLAVAMVHPGPLNVVATLVVLALLLLSLWRFVDQRYKATRQAYWSVIVLTARSGGSAPETAAALPGQQPYVQAVVCRKRRNSLAYLFVEDEKESGRWVLPGGDIEDGESPAEAAVRAVYEQAGAWARMGSERRTHVLIAAGAPRNVTVHLMQWAGYGLPRERSRRRSARWVSKGEAASWLAQEETRELLAVPVGD